MYRLRNKHLGYDALMLKALFWSAVINGVIAVPIMAVMMVLASHPPIMGIYTISTRLRWLGWISTVVMSATATAMMVTI